MSSWSRARRGPQAWPLVALLAASVGEARTLEVGRGESLAKALEQAANGDTVSLARGTYAGRFTISRSVTLRGAGAVIDGRGQGTTLRVDAPGVTIAGIEIRGSGSDLGGPDACVYATPKAQGLVFRGNRLRDCAFGLWVHETKDVRIEDNDVRGRDKLPEVDRGNGIHLFDASNARILRNVVTGARDGIYVAAVEDSLFEGNRLEHQRYGVHYMYSYRNTLRNNESSHNLGGFALMQSGEMNVIGNVATKNKRHGILFRDAQGCTIQGNIIRENDEGFFFYSSTENAIEGNRLEHNRVGARIWAGTLRNRVTKNAFVGNTQQIYYVGSNDLVLGEKEPGNAFSDYMGWDQDGDGVGDRPYRLDSFTSHLTYRYPAAVLLLRSPALELLAHLEERLPLLRVPTIIDKMPLVSADKAAKALPR